MSTTAKSMTPLEILEAIDSLSDEEKETLAIMADKKLAEELLRRRKEALVEMTKGELLDAEDLFKET